MTCLRPGSTSRAQRRYTKRLECCFVRCEGMQVVCLQQLFDQGKTFSGNQLLHDRSHFSSDHGFTVSASALCMTMFVFDIQLIIRTGWYFASPWFDLSVQHYLPCRNQYRFIILNPHPLKRLSLDLSMAASANSYCGANEGISSCSLSWAVFWRHFLIVINFNGRTSRSGDQRKTTMSWGTFLNIWALKNIYFR